MALTTENLCVGLPADNEMRLPIFETVLGAEIAC